MILLFVFLFAKNKYRTTMKFNVSLSANIASMFAFALVYLRNIALSFDFYWFSLSAAILYVSATVIFFIIVLNKKWSKALSWLCLAIAIAVGYIFYVPTGYEEYQMPLFDIIYSVSFRFFTVAVLPIFLLVFPKMFTPVNTDEAIEQKFAVDKKTT